MYGAALLKRGTTIFDELRQCVFATDYPQAACDDDEVAAYVDAMRALGPEAKAILEGTNVTKLIPDINERLRSHAA